MEASYRVVIAIMKDKKTNGIGEWLVKPYARNIVEMICGKEQKKKL